MNPRGLSSIFIYKIPLLMKYFAINNRLIRPGSVMVIAFVSCVLSGQDLRIEYAEDMAAIAFAASHIEKEYAESLQAEPLTVSLQINPSLKTQSYSIRFPASEAILVEGGDETGLMYGGLRLAELIRLNGSLQFDEEKAEPYLLRRGLKMDLTLDARSLGYDDTGDAGQENIRVMWDPEFWEAFLDRMALHRYNALTLWHPHPFPLMLELEKYPGVAMEDVYKSTYPWEHKEHPRYAPDDAEEHMELIRRMSPGEKIAHWQQVMDHARDRGIEIYFITWNIHLDGARGKHGITAEQDNELTIEYLRYCVKEFLDTYPNLTGLGLTAGEMMKERHDQYSKEKWLWRTYGLGISDALEKDPDRRFRFIHRVWESGMEPIMEDFGSRFPGDFEVSFKYARGRMYAHPNPPFANGLLEELRPYEVKSWWNIRNDDLYSFRWGDPEFARSFIRNIPREQTAGIHMGSDGYLWGRNFFTRDPEMNGQLEIDKHWYNFMMWGRLAYDPGTDRSFFEARLADRYPGVPAALLYDTWAAVSRIPNLVNQFHWRDWDFQWNYEICSEIYHFHSVEDFISSAPVEGSGMISIEDYILANGDNQVPGVITPPEVVRQIRILVSQARAGLEAMGDYKGGSKERKHLEEDIRAMASLGDYYAAKISGAIHLAAYRASGDRAEQQKAVSELEGALKAWKSYARIAMEQYLPQDYARTRSTDLHALIPEVEKDIEIAGQGPVVNQTH